MDCSNGTPNLKPFHCLGSCRPLCFWCRTTALPLVFSIAATRMGVGVDPTPIEIASGMGRINCDASYSPLMSLSRTSAHEGVRASSTSRPSDSKKPNALAARIGTAQVTGT